MPKSKVRKKSRPRLKSPQTMFESRDPVLGAVLKERKWRYLGEDQIADAWDFPGLRKIGMQTLITGQPDGYAADYFLEGASTPFKSTFFSSREELIEQLEFLETWGQQILELRKLAK
jgi:hypothetical protein